ncbi:ABC transporter permease [Jonesia denitrificans]|uniref:Binding-protein-dependent transport systems inner membrane component n=1 Tax=Jonesia denitrificans (strain ATCC 14870 / DSM 20603 / BCRC 15368 / CIP 55.134 / JCM 11481 / NBRC 15587 / NCTC 10816 / Prevot 55134) TaxID=471856 RepID=C7R207_JONDD|nr:ABC transporter permease subunit [Jonesia denitrificans]ACV09895.1 binding-protein-dependent transport systems inner membrane component [Jonesia denitrificans DSM 20603]ASE08917.1 ABC transporter permease [Jonesia denitrificans]QXB43465.1 ABC transporter permease subunit [Jonesia denitrificans]SQH22603.1 Glycine betaine/L-proline transport system permease protein proW [Jonesia denitrificans]
MLVDILGDAWGWLSTADHWVGPSGIGARLGEHLVVTCVVVVLAAVVSVPLGLWAGHSGRGGDVIVGLAGSARALPTLGLLTLAALLLGIGLVAPVIALTVLAIPPLLNATYAGVVSIRPSVTGAARAVGMSGRQLLAFVEIPLAAPHIVGGFRSATLQVIATATLAAYTSNTGLGRYIFSGLKTQDYGLLVAGSVLVIALALLVDAVFVWVHRLSARHMAGSVERRS